MQCLLSQNARVYINLNICTVLAHNLKLILRGPAHLRKAQTTFDTLEVLARCFITEDMRLLVALV